MAARHVPLVEADRVTLQTANTSLAQVDRDYGATTLVIFDDELEIAGLSHDHTPERLGASDGKT